MIPIWLLTGTIGFMIGLIGGILLERLSNRQNAEFREELIMKVWAVFEIDEDGDGYTSVDFRNAFKSKEKAMKSYPTTVERTRKSIPASYHVGDIDDFGGDQPYYILEEIEVY
jgi:hypothetical protein